MTSGLLDSIEFVLRACDKPMSAKAIAKELADREVGRLGGLTPWKTVGARLAVDMRSNPKTRFIRVGRGMYALKDWGGLSPVEVPARRINPLDEDILVIDQELFVLMERGRLVRSLYDISYKELLRVARPINRTMAEADSSLVQLIPSFVIFRGNTVLSFKRTRKTPEQRLHDSYSIVFGGHLQSEDSPSLFANLDDMVETFLFRELHEELSFAPQPQRSRYCGVLHLDGTDFERQHAGVVFAIELAEGTKVQSLEPGYHSTLEFLLWETINSSPVMQDRWSAACIAHMQEA